MNKKDLQMELVASTALLQKSVDALHENGANLKPGIDKWSASEILEHMLLLEVSVNKMLRLPAIRAERDYDKKKELIVTVFNNDEKHYDSPVLYFPKGKQLNKHYLMGKLGDERNLLAKLIESHNLEETSDAFKHPGFGNFTRYEWVQFIIQHSNRHARQIEKIAMAMPLVDPLENR